MTFALQSRTSGYRARAVAFRTSKKRIIHD